MTSSKPNQTGPYPRRSSWQEAPALVEKPTRRFSHRLTLRNSPSGNTEDEVLAPISLYKPDGLQSRSGVHGEERSGHGKSGGSKVDVQVVTAPPRTARRIIASVASLACASALVAGVVLPPNNAALSDLDFASTQPQTLLSTGGLSDDVSLIGIDSAAPVEIAPVLGADGEVSNLSELSNSKTRYPFDTEVPLTDPFGYRTAPVEGFHDAQDMAAAGGTPIRIVASGIVTEAGFASDGCGFALKVQHRVDNTNVTSRYCHMQENSHLYQVGDLVTIGDQAGLVGNTGMSFGAHLHLAMRQEDSPIDPLPFLAANAA